MVDKIGNLPIQHQALAFLRQAAQAAGYTNAFQLARQAFEARDPHAIGGMAWVAFNGLKGIIAPPKMPDIDGPALARQGLNFASNPTLLNKILFRTFGPESQVYTHLTLAATLLVTGRFLAYAAHEVGLKRYFEIYEKTLNGDERFQFGKEELELQKKLLLASRRFYCTWVVAVAKAAGWDIRYENFDKLLESGDVIVANHAAIRGDFLATLGALDIMPVADDDNFRNGAKQKKYGLSMVVDLLKLPLIHRDERDIKIMGRCFKDITESARDLGIIPLWFITAGRTPEVRLKAPYGRDEKDFNFPGYFSNAPDPKNLRTYVRSGAVRNAFDIAKKSGKPTHIAIMTIDGSHYADPKRSKKFPFSHKMRTRETIRYRVGEKDLTITQGGKWDKKISEAWSASIDRMIRDDMGIDQKLARLVGILGEEKGYQGLENRFAELGRQDVGWFISVDRMRSVPDSEFPPLCDRLLDMVRSENPVPVEGLDALLKTVSDAVLAAEPK